MKRLMLFLLLPIAACSSAPSKNGPHFFLGRESDECVFVGYLNSSSHESSEDKSFAEAKKQLLKQSQAVGANMLKIVNVNRMVTAVSLSVESYRCSSLLKLQITDDPKIDF